MNIDYKLIGKRIKVKREQRNITQMELAERADLSVPYISHIETGSKKVSLNALIRIANALSISPNDLLLDHITLITDSVDSEFAQILIDCTDNQKKFLIDILHSIKPIIQLKKWIK